MHDRWLMELRGSASGISVDVVLDVGAGAGRFWPIFREAWNPRVIVAIDTSSSMLRAGTAADSVFRVVADIDALPVADDAISVCFCSMVLHYSDDPIQTVRRLSNCLRRNGLLIVRTGTAATLESYDFLPYFPTAHQAEVRALPSSAAAEVWVRSAGFDDVVVREIEMPPVGSRRQQLARVLWRGFPSLQLVPRREFTFGVVRYSLASVHGFLRGRPMPGERVLFITARRM